MDFLQRFVQYNEALESGFKLNIKMKLNVDEVLFSLLVFSQLAFSTGSRYSSTIYFYWFSEQHAFYLLLLVCIAQHFKMLNMLIDKLTKLFSHTHFIFENVYHQEIVVE